MYYPYSPYYNIVVPVIPIIRLLATPLLTLQVDLVTLKVRYSLDLAVNRSQLEPNNSGEKVRQNKRKTQCTPKPFDRSSYFYYYDYFSYSITLIASVTTII